MRSKTWSLTILALCTLAAITALAISGLCALIIGLLYGGPFIWVLVVALIWGMAIIADSGQFSSAIAELAPPERIGTMLTAQTCAGFMLTLGTLHLMPYMIDLVGWRYAFAGLSLGPLFGIISMARLRNLDEACKLAGGKR